MLLYWKSLLKNGLYFNTILLIIIGLFSSCLIVPTSVINSAYLQGPSLWFLLMFGILVYCSGIKLLYNNYKLVFVSFNKIDLVIGLIFTYLICQSIFLDAGNFPSNKLLIFLCLIISYYLLKFHISSLTKAQIIAFTQIITGFIFVLMLITSFYGVYQLTLNNNLIKISGPYYNPARYANFIVAILPFALCAIIFYPGETYILRTKIGFVSGIICILNMIVLGFTYTRAAWIGIAVSVLFLSIKKYAYIFIKIKKSIFMLAFVVAVIITVAIVLYQFKPQSVLGRVTIWKVCSEIITRNPVIGIGYGNFDKRYNSYQANYFLKNKITEGEIQRADTVRYAYNEFLHVLCEQGFIGFILFFLLLYYVSKSYFTSANSKDKYKSYLTKSCFTCLISIVICAQFSYPFDILPVLIVFFLYIAILSGIENIIGGLKSKNTFQCSIKSSVLSIVGIGLLVLGTLNLNNTIKKFNAYKSYRTAKNSQDFALIYGIMIEDSDFINLYSNVLYNENKYKEIINLLEDRKDLMYPSMLINLGLAYEAQKQGKKAETCYLTALNMIPNRFYSKYILAIFYFQSKQYEKARGLSNDIISTKPKVPSPLISSIKSEIKELLIKYKK